MCVCVFVLYACMCACMCVCIIACMYACVHASNGCMHVCMHACVYACTYVRNRTKANVSYPGPLIWLWLPNASYFGAPLHQDARVFHSGRPHISLAVSCWALAEWLSILNPPLGPLILQHHISAVGPYCGSIVSSI